MKPGNLEIKKLKTGINGFDLLLNGGVPENRALLIVGSAGTGKTVFLNSFVYYGIKSFNQNAVFVTFEEKPEDIKKNVRSFGWDYDALIRSGKLVFVDASHDGDVSEYESGRYDFTPVIERIKYAVKKNKAKRVAIDSLSALFEQFSDQKAIRRFFFTLYDELKKMGVTTLISAEKSADGQFSKFAVEQYVVDGVIEVDFKAGQQHILREMTVRKLRGTTFKVGKVDFEITAQGVEVYPKIAIRRDILNTSYDIRLSSENAKLDSLLNGGFPQGHMCLVTGNTGTGKSMMAAHFLLDGLRKGEKGVYVALEEHVDEVKKASMARGIDLGSFEKKGLLRFVSPDSLIDIAADKFLYQIINMLTQINAKRLVFDSVTSLASATMSEESVRQFLIQMACFLKMKGVTCLATYLSTASFGASSDQLLSGLETNAMRLSSIVDCIILLRYVERNQSIKKLLTVLKIRGSRHSKDIMEFEISEKGIEIKEIFKS